MVERRSPLALAVLGVLSGGPLHAYGIQKQLRELGKDRVVNIRQRGSVYQTIDRLARHGLIAVQGTDRAGGHPDRTVYAVTEEGTATAREWLRDMLAATGTDFPDFPVAVSFLMMLTPDDARHQLTARIDALAVELTEVDDMLRSVGDLPRLFVLEEEYRRAILHAQLIWTRSVVTALASGALSWDDEWVRQVYATHTGSTHD